MTELTCRDYGFDCDYAVDGKVEEVIEKFRGHMEGEHGIDYSREAVMQFILRKQ